MRIVIVQLICYGLTSLAAFLLVRQLYLVTKALPPSDRKLKRLAEKRRLKLQAAHDEQYESTCMECNTQVDKAKDVYDKYHQKWWHESCYRKYYHMGEG